MDTLKLGFPISIIVAQREYTAAEPILRECVQLPELVLPDSDWRIASVRSILGASLAGQGKFDEAEPLMVKALNALQGDPESPVTKVREALVRLVKLYDARREPEKAARAREILSEIPKEQG